MLRVRLPYKHTLNLGIQAAGSSNWKLYKNIATMDKLLMKRYKFTNTLQKYVA